MIKHYSDENPESVALIYEKDGEKAEMTYTALKDRIDLREKELIDSGKTSIGIFCSGEVECITTIFAAAKASLPR
jgi:long-subunit acyl-CoA synthetase (AMP-forming)